MFIEHEFYIEIVEYAFLISVGQFSNAVQFSTRFLAQFS
jgi:hypothetical protein